MSATMSFGIQRIDRKDFQVLSVSGYMGNSECAKLESHLVQIFGQGHRQVILDFAALTFVTSASLSRLAKQARWLEREGGTIQLSGVSASVGGLIKLARLERSLTMVPDLATAIKSMADIKPPGLPTGVGPQKQAHRPKKPAHRGARKYRASAFNTHS